MIRLDKFPKHPADPMDYIEPTPGFIVFAPFKPMRAQCEVCGRAYRKTQRNRYTCGRPECKNEHCRRLVAIRNAKRRGKSVDLSRKRKRRHQARRKSPSKPPPDQGVPICCGASLAFGTDMLGRTTQICWTCGERPMRLHGKRIYDQRDRLEQEIHARLEIAESPLLKPVAEDVGDAFRQDTHKRGRGAKGLVEHLGAA